MNWGTSGHISDEHALKHASSERDKQNPIITSNFENSDDIKHHEKYGRDSSNDAVSAHPVCFFDDGASPNVANDKANDQRYKSHDEPLFSGSASWTN